MYLELICTVFILYVIKFVIVRIRIEWQLKNFVKPPGHWILQHWHVFQDKNETLPKITDLANKYGSLLRLYMGGVAFLFITDKEFLRLLLGTTAIMNKDDTYKKTESWLGTGLLTCRKEKWMKTRKILTPAFHLHVLEKYTSNCHYPISILIKKLEKYVDQKPFDVFPLVTLCSLDIICETAMGTSINVQDNDESDYVKCVKEMVRIVQDRSQSLFKQSNFLYAFSKDFWKERRALKVLHGFTKEVIRKKKIEKKNSNDSPAPKKKLSFLDLLLEAKINDRYLNDKEIRHEVDTFMFAGHDTTASAICFTLYCLSEYVEVQNAAIEELNKIFGEDDRYPTFQDLQEMHYLNLVIKESLRLYPPVPMFIRSPDEDTQLGEWTIPKETSVIVFAYGVHRNPDYFPEPEKFIPERFESEIEPYTYIPFSLGSRNCIGQKFAVFEIKAVISTILRNFKILPVDGYEPVPITNVVLGSANGIQVKLTRRK